MVTLLEVMITSQVTITSQEVIVTSPRRFKPHKKVYFETLGIHRLMMMMIVYFLA